MKKQMCVNQIIEVEVDDDMLDEVLLYYALEIEYPETTIDDMFQHIAMSNSQGTKSIPESILLIGSNVKAISKGIDSFEIQPKSTESEGI